MDNTGKRLSKRAALRKELRDFVEGASCWTLSLALAMSLVPPAAIAYAMEDAPSGESAPAAQSADDPQVEPEGSGEAAPEEEAPAQPAPEEETPAPEGEGGDEQDAPTPAPTPAPAPSDEAPKNSGGNAGSDDKDAPASNKKADAGKGGASKDNNSSSKGDNASSDKADENKDDDASKKDEPPVETTKVVSPTADEIESMKDAITIEGTLAPKDKSLTVQNDTVYASGAVEETLTLNVGNRPDGVKDVKFDASTVDVEGGQNLSIYGGADNRWTIRTPEDKGVYDLSQIKSVKGTMTYTETTTEVNKATGQAVGAPETKDQTVEFTEPVSLRDGSVLRANVDTTPPEITVSVNSSNPDALAAEGAGSATLTRHLDLSGGAVASIAVTAKEDDSKLDTTNNQSAVTLEWKDAGGATLSTETKPFPEDGGTVVFDGLSADMFVDGNNAKTAYITYKATNEAALSTNYWDDGSGQVSAVSLKSESAWLEGATVKVEPSNNKSTTRAEGGVDVAVYNSDVTVSVDDGNGNPLNATATIKDNGSSITDVVAAGNDSNDKHDIEVELKTPGGYTKTITKTFYIDTVLPKVDSATLSGTTKTDSTGQKLVYGEGDTVLLEVVADAATSHALNTSNPYVISIIDTATNKEIAGSVTLQNDGADPRTEALRYVVDADANAVAKKDLQINVTPVSIFDEPNSPGGEKQTQVFRIDRADPVVALDFSGDLTILGSKVGYKTGVLTVTVTDDNLKDVEITGEGGKNIASAKDLGTDKYEQQFLYVSDPNNPTAFVIGEGLDREIHVKATDDAGNTKTYDYNPRDSKSTYEGGAFDGSVTDKTFDIDNSSVELVDFTINGSKADTLNSIDVYDMDSLDVSVTLKDAHFDKGNSFFTVRSSSGTETATGGAWQPTGNDGEYRATITISEPADKQASGETVVFELSAKATDLLANETASYDYKNSVGENKIALDSQPPATSVAYSATPSGTHNGIDYYNVAKLTATVTAKDPFFDSSVNGSWRSVDNGDNGVYTKDIDFDENSIGTTHTLNEAAQDKLSHSVTTTYKFSEKGDPDRYQTDVASDQFVLDSKPPRIESVSFSTPAVGEYKGTDYYTQATTATITVSDNNFNDDASVSYVTVPKDSGATWSGKWQDKDSQGNPLPQGTYMTTVTYEQTPVDSVSDFTITAKDYANNLATEKTKYQDYGVGGKNLVVDTDSPTITIEFDQAPVGAYEGNDYYDKQPTATITVKDRTFDKDNSPIDPRGQLADEVKGWSSEDNETWTAVVPFGENRETVSAWTSALQVATVDKAYLASGRTLKDHNDKKSYKNRQGAPAGGPDKFVYDATPVQVTASIDANVKATFASKDFYNKTVKVTLTVVDNNFDTNSTPKTVRGPQFSGWATKDNKTYTTTLVFDKDSTNINSPYDVNVDAFDKVYTASGKKATYHKTWYDYRNTTSDTTRTNLSGASGNATGFIIDRTAPTIDSVLNGNYPSATSPSGIQFFNVMTSLKYSFSDANGLAELELSDPDGQYTIGKGTEGFSMGAMKGGPVSMSLVEKVSHVRDAYDGFARVVGSPVILRVRDITGNFTEWAIDRNGNIVGKSSGTHVTIDGRGIRPSALVMDTTAPVVSLSPTSLEGTFSNQTQTVTCSVDEFNFHYLKEFDPSRAIVYITKYEGNAGRAMSTWTLNAGQFSGGGSSWSTSYPFSEDGHYIVEAYFKDYAENMSNRVRIGEFTIDKTPPRIDSIVFDNNNSVYNNGYYNAARTATITVTEHNWDANLEGSFITTNGQILGWSHSGDTHIATVLFGTDGDYNLSVRVTDRAGNVSTQETVPEFTVDLTQPEMIIYNAAAEGEDDTLNGHAYNDAIQPAVRFTDKTTGKQTFDPNNTSLWSVEMQPANGSAEGGSLSYPMDTSSSGANDLTVTYEDFTREVEYDDVYTMTARMTDLAGNPAKVIVPEQDASGNDKGGTAEVRFSVNRFGSNFIVIDPDRYTEKNGYMSPGDFNKEGAQPVQIAEINVSGYSEQGMGESDESYWDAIKDNHDVSVTHGLDTKALDVQRSEKGDANKDGYWVDDEADVKDEKTKESVVPNEWQVYTYNVYGPNFDKDGDYLVAVSSKDVATNANVSGEYYNHQAKKIDNAQVSFTFDRTAPRIENVNLENGGLYDHGKYRTVAFSASDNYEMDIAKVLIDGEEAEVEYNKDENMYYATIEAKSFTPRSIVITAVDRAGNEESFTIEGARVTNNVFELHWPIMLAVGAAGIGGGIIYKKRRDQQNEEEAA